MKLSVAVIRHDFYLDRYMTLYFKIVVVMDVVLGGSGGAAPIVKIFEDFRGAQSTFRCQAIEHFS